MAEKLLPCPFCGAGQTTIHVNKGTWNGRSFGEPSSVEVRHWCEQAQGQPSRMLSRVGRDEASAIAAWNKRAQHAGEAGEPVAWHIGNADGSINKIGAVYIRRSLAEKHIASYEGGLDASIVPLYAAPQPAAVPYGFMLVPVTPTDEMLATLLSEGEYGVLAQHSMDPIGASAVLRLSGVASRYADMLAVARREQGE